jgi:hypothetical protein
VSVSPLFWRGLNHGESPDSTLSKKCNDDGKCDVLVGVCGELSDSLGSGGLKWSMEDRRADY